MMDYPEFALRLAAALGFGTIIGFERQWSRHMAGLQTNALVSTGAAVFVLSGVLAPGVTTDLHIAAQIVTGIGFIGSGVILRDGLHVRGLNTAATLWCSAGVGILSGFGLLGQAAAAMVAVVLINTLLRYGSHAIDRRAGMANADGLRYRFQATVALAQEATFRTLFAQHLQLNKMQLVRLDAKPDGDRVLLTAEIQSAESAEARLTQLSASFGIAQGVDSTHWQALSN